MVTPPDKEEGYSTHIAIHHIVKNYLRKFSIRRQILLIKYALHGHKLDTKDSSMCLGVTISQDLSWKQHIDATAVKGQRTRIDKKKPQEVLYRGELDSPHNAYPSIP